MVPLVTTIIEVVIEIIRVLLRRYENSNWKNSKESESLAEEIPHSKIKEQVKTFPVDLVQYRYPVSNLTVTSPFGNRILPGVGNQFHNGTDFSGRLNEYSVAPCDCIVGRILKPDYEYPSYFKNTSKGWQKVNVPDNRAWTPYVELYASHDSNICFVHKHGDPLVVVGQQVKIGSKITKIGNYGYSQGPHLHDEVWVKKLGKWVCINPEKFYKENVKESFNV